MTNYIVKTLIAATVVGAGAAAGYKQYTKDVTIIRDDKRNAPVFIKDLIKEKTSETPIYVSYRIPIREDASAITPTTMVESMFSSWTMFSEKIILWLTMPHYEPLTTEVTHSIFGMFKIEAVNPDIAVLNWKLLHMGGLHLFQKKENVAMFDTIMWSTGTPSSLLLEFHDIYSKLLLATAVKKLEH